MNENIERKALKSYSIHCNLFIVFEISIMQILLDSSLIYILVHVHVFLWPILEYICVLKIGFKLCSLQCLLEMWGSLLQTCWFPPCGWSDVDLSTMTASCLWWETIHLLTLRQMFVNLWQHVKVCIQTWRTAKY